MNQQEWKRLAEHLYVQASDSLYQYHRDAYCVLNALAVVAAEMAKKGKDDTD